MYNRITLPVLVLSQFYTCSLPSLITAYVGHLMCQHVNSIYGIFLDFDFRFAARNIRYSISLACLYLVMGPDNSHNLHSRPKFSFGLKNRPWTDGRGNQESYYSNVVLWKSMHDKLHQGHSIKNDPQLQGIILKF